MRDTAETPGRAEVVTRAVKVVMAVMAADALVAARRGRSNVGSGCARCGPDNRRCARRASRAGCSNKEAARAMGERAEVAAVGAAAVWTVVVAAARVEVARAADVEVEAARAAEEVVALAAMTAVMMEAAAMAAAMEEEKALFCCVLYCSWSAVHASHEAARRQRRARAKLRGVARLAMHSCTALKRV